MVPVEMLNQLVANAQLAHQQGNIPLAEILCRIGQDNGPPRPDILTLLGRIAAGLGEHGAAAGYFRAALRAQPGWGPAVRGLAEAESRAAAPAAEGTDAWRRGGGGEARGYLLMKAWGCGFWADCNQALGQLLLAEMTGRTPVTMWGANSRFRAPGSDDAWKLYYEPVSNLTAGDLDLEGGGGGLFPGKWNPANVSENDVSKWNGPDSRMAGLLFLNRPERIAVADFHTSVADLRAWIPAEHPLHGRDLETVYRTLAKRYLRPRADIAAEIEEFHRAHLAGGPTLAVHVRATDKVTEIPDLQRWNLQYRPLIDRAIAERPELRLFLLTDSAPTLEEYRARYGARLVATECRRSSSKVGVHFDPELSEDRRRIGVEVMKDAYLAARCDRFLGFGSSAVSCMISHLRDWGPGECTLIGHYYHGDLMPSIYVR